MTKNALLIEWNPSSGKRAGNINPRDPGLFCNAWQNMDVSPAIELRTIEDDRDIKQYVTMEGVTVLYGPDQINKAIDQHFPSKYRIEDETFYAVQLKKKADLIDFDSLSNNQMKRLKTLSDQYGIKGIKEIKPKKV